MTHQPTSFRIPLLLPHGVGVLSPTFVCWAPRDETQPASQMPPFTLVTCSWDQYRKTWCFADSHVGGLGGRGWGALEMGAELKAEEPDGKGEGAPTGSSNPFCLLVKPQPQNGDSLAEKSPFLFPTEPQGGRKLCCGRLGCLCPSMQFLISVQMQKGKSLASCGCLTLPGILVFPELGGGALEPLLIFPYSLHFL